MSFPPVNPYANVAYAPETVAPETVVAGNPPPVGQFNGRMITSHGANPFASRASQPERSELSDRQFGKLFAAVNGMGVFDTIQSRLARLSPDSLITESKRGLRFECATGSTFGKVNMVFTFASHHRDGSKRCSNDIGVKCEGNYHHKSFEQDLDNAEMKLIHASWPLDQDIVEFGTVERKHYVLNFGSPGLPVFSISARLDIDRNVPDGFSFATNMVAITVKLPGQEPRSILKEIKPGDPITIGSHAASGSQSGLFEFISQIPEVEAMARARGQTVFYNEDNEIKILLTPLVCYKKQVRTPPAPAIVEHHHYYHPYPQPRPLNVNIYGPDRHYRRPAANQPLGNTSLFYGGEFETDDSGFGAYYYREIPEVSRGVNEVYRPGQNQLDGVSARGMALPSDVTVHDSQAAGVSSRRELEAISSVKVLPGVYLDIQSYQLLN